MSSLLCWAKSYSAAEASTIVNAWVSFILVATLRRKPRTLVDGLKQLSELFAKLCKFFEGNDECQYSIPELIGIVSIRKKMKRYPFRMFGSNISWRVIMGTMSSEWEFSNVFFFSHLTINYSRRLFQFLWYGRKELGNVLLTYFYIHQRRFFQCLQFKSYSIAKLYLSRDDL